MCKATTEFNLLKANKSLILKPIILHSPPSPHPPSTKFYSAGKISFFFLTTLEAVSYCRMILQLIPKYIYIIESKITILGGKSIIFLAKN